MSDGHVRHFIQGPFKFHGSNAPYHCGATTDSATTKRGTVTCPACLTLMGSGQSTDSIIHYRRAPSSDLHFSFRCGAMTGESTRDMAWVSCADCINLMETGGSEYRPHKAPPYMNDNDDGVFIFTDTHHGAGYTMEVVPQTTGNVEITIEEPGGEGHLFTLSHLDRMDLIRALLHDFHYSPERGGPNDG